MSGTLSGRYTVFGNTPAYIGTFTLSTTNTTASAQVPGIKRVKAFNATPVSGATSIFSVNMNTNSGGSSVDGWIGITSALSSNIFSVLIFGEE